MPVKKKKPVKKPKKSNENKKIKKTKDGKPVLDIGTQRKLTEAEQTALRICRDNPGMSMADISRELIDKGLCKNTNYLAARKSQNKLLASELQRIYEENESFLATQIVPKAMEHHKKALDKKSMPESKRFKWVKLAHDSYFKQMDRKPQRVEQNVNILQIQQHIQESLKEDKPIDITPKEETED